MIEWLQKLGYGTTSENLIVSERSRCFVLSVHSDAPVQASIFDTLLNDIEFKSNELIIKKFGREIYSNGPIKVYCAFSE